MFWATTLLQVALELSSLLLFYESYAPVLLCQRAEKWHKETGDSRYHAEVEMPCPAPSAYWHSIQSIVQIQAILEGINYGLLDFALASFSALHVSAYGESITVSGLHYIAICTGTISGAQLCGPFLDYVYKRLTTRTGDAYVPELRIPLLLPGVFFTPIGFLLYGWAAQHHLFWLIVDVGAALLSLGMRIFDTTLHPYVMDAYPEHINSASAATQVLRILLTFAFPLSSNSLYDTLGYGQGNSLLAFLSIGIALPSTGILWRFGAKLRARRQTSY